MSGSVVRLRPTWLLRRIARRFAATRLIWGCHFLKFGTLQSKRGACIADIPPPPLPPCARSFSSSPLSCFLSPELHWTFRWPKRGPWWRTSENDVASIPRPTPTAPGQACHQQEIRRHQPPLMRQRSSSWVRHTFQTVPNTIFAVDVGRWRDARACPPPCAWLLGTWEVDHHRSIDDIPRGRCVVHHTCVWWSSPVVIVSGHTLLITYLLNIPPKLDPQFGKGSRRNCLCSMTSCHRIVDTAATSIRTHAGTILLLRMITCTVSTVIVYGWIFALLKYVVGSKYDAICRPLIL